MCLASFTQRYVYEIHSCCWMQLFIHPCCSSIPLSEDATIDLFCVGGRLDGLQFEVVTMRSWTYIFVHMCTFLLGIYLEMEHLGHLLYEC